MANSSKIGDSVFGYNKLDVNKYIGDLAESYKMDSDKKEEQIKRLMATNEELMTKIIAYEKIIKDYEAQREIVAHAIIKAEAEAAKIAEQANESAAARRAEIDEQLKAERTNLEQARAELSSFQKSAVKIIEKFEAELRGLIGE